MGFDLRLKGAWRKAALPPEPAAGGGGGKKEAQETSSTKNRGSLNITNYTASIGSIHKNLIEQTFNQLI